MTDTAARCPSCFKRLDTMHRALGRCPAKMDTAPRKVNEPRSQSRYVPPSRAHRVPRADYLAAVRVDAETKRAQRRARQARWRDKRKQAA